MASCRILIVEDEAIVAMDIEGRLAALGYQLAGRAPSGVEALVLAEQHRPDLVLMDIRLQGPMDGIAAAEEMRRRFRLPVIFLTAYAEDTTLERAKLAEPFGYLLKPFDDRELKSTIEIACYKHRAEEEIRRLTRLYDVLSQVNQAVVRLQSKEELFPTVCRVVVERGGIDLAWIGWLDSTTGRIVPAAQFGTPSEIVSEATITADDQPAGQGNLVKAIREGRPAICNDCDGTACLYPSAQAPARGGFHSCAAFLLRFQGQVCGTLNLCVAEPGFFQEREIRLLEEVALNLSFALDQFEVTARREQTEAALRESEARHRRLFEEAIEGICLADADTGEIVDCNTAFLRLTGYEKDELLGQPQRMLHPPESGSPPVSATFARHRTDAPGQVLRAPLVTKAGPVKRVEIKANLLKLAGRRLLQGYFRDVTEEFRYQRERERTLTLLGLLNNPDQTHELIQNVTGCLQEWSGCEAVGVRLRVGEDFPYFETRGMPSSFVQGESQLCLRDAAGQPIRDPEGHPALECLCGIVLNGRFDPDKPFFTPKGSFWTNHLTRLLTSPDVQDCQARLRNRCHVEGYESVALIPLRHGQATLGLLQVVDHASGRFTPELLEFLEHAADQIAIGLDQRQAHAALQASEGRFRALVETAFDWIWEVDAQGNYTYASPRIRDLLGYAPEEVIGRTPLDFMPEEEARRVGAIFAAVTAVRRPFVALENVNLHRDGRRVVLETSGVPMFGLEGEFTGYRGSDRDITARKQAEAAIQERLQLEERLSRLAAAVPGVMYSFRMRSDGSVCFPYAGPAVERLFGLRPEEPMDDASAFFRLVHPEDAAYVQESIQESARQLSPWRAEFRVRHPQQGEIWIEGRSAPEREPDGSILWHGFAYDISVRKQAEQALRDSDERFRLAMEATSDGLWERDIPTGHTYYSPAYVRMLGYTPEEFATTCQTWADLIHPEDRERTLAVNQACIDNRRRAFLAEFRMRTKGGEWRWILGRGEAVTRDADGRALRMIGTHVDITARKRAEAHLRRSEATAVQLARESAIMAEIGRIVSSTLNIDEVYERFAEEVRKLVPFDRLVINTIDVKQNAVRNVHIAGEDLSDRNVSDVYPLQGSGNAEMVRTQATLLIQTEDFTAYEGRFPMLASTFRAGFRSILNVPLFSKGTIIGGLLLRSRNASAYAEKDVRLAERIGSQIAGAIANAQLYAERVAAETERKRGEEALAARTQQLEAVRAISMEITRELDLTALLQLIVERAVQLVVASSGTCFLWDETAQRLVPHAWIGYGEWRREVRLRLGEGLAGQVAHRREGLMTANYPAEPYALPQMLTGKQVKAAVGEPLLYHNRLIGVLTIDHVGADQAFTLHDQELLRLIAAQAAIAIENARLFAERERAAREARSLYEVAHRLTTSLEPLEVLRLIAVKTTELLGTEHAQVVLWDEGTQSLRLGASVGTDVEHVQKQDFQVGEGVNGIVAQTRAPLVVNDYQAFPHRVTSLTHVTADIAVPLLYQGRLLGVLNTHRTQSGLGFTPGHLALLTSFAAQAAIAIENARLFAELQQAMEDIHRAQAELVRTETLRALGQMAAGIAHDLNNTFASLLGQVELQKLRAMDSTAQEGLALLETATVDGAQIVQRLLNFARPKGTTALGPVDLTTIVRESVELTRPRWKDEPERRGLTVHVTLEIPVLPPVLGNAPELREAITNLLFNAVDAMPDGGTVTLAAHTIPDGITLMVKDTGIGMPPEIQARLFEPFFTTKGTRGTGLGLAAVYGIVERHGGRIAVQSAIGQGTTVTLTFRSATTEAARGEGQPGTARPTTPRRLLVVDDEPMVRTTIVALLRAIGHIVTEAADGATALRLLGEAPLDLVLTDLGMPKMNGWELAKAVKVTHPTLPVVLLTGWQEQVPAEQTDRQAVDVILGKPVRLEALRKVVADLTASSPV